MTSAPPFRIPENLKAHLAILTPELALRRAKTNMIVAVFGDSKTGKTDFVVRSQGPRYIAYLDPNSTLMYHLEKAAKSGRDGYGPWPMFGEDGVQLFFPLELPPLNIANLTDEAAQAYLDEVVSFARLARNQAEAAVAAGKSGGTFIVDGMTMLKGYAEKAILGFSATLGERTEKGGRGPSTFEYAKSNNWLRQFVADFVGSNLDLIVSWEGSATYIETKSDNGQTKSVKTGKFKPTMPDRTAFAINALVETVMVQENRVVDNKIVGYKVVPMVRIAYNSFDKDLSGVLMPGMGFQALKDLFLGDLPAEKVQAVKDTQGAEFVRVNQEIVSGEADQDMIEAVTTELK